MYHLDQRHHIFADAAAHELAVEHHVVDVTNDNHFGTRIADLRKPVELADNFLSSVQRFNNDQIRRGGIAIKGVRRLHSAHLHCHMRLAEPSILRRLLDCDGGRLILAKSLNVDTRNWTRTAWLDTRLRRLPGLLGFRAQRIFCGAPHRAPILAASLAVACSDRGFWSGPHTAPVTVSPFKYLSPTVSRRSLARGVSARGPIRSRGSATATARFRWVAQPILGHGVFCGSRLTFS